VVYVLQVYRPIVFFFNNVSGFGIGVMLSEMN
jgi:hypothetical protein